MIEILLIVAILIAVAASLPGTIMTLTGTIRSAWHQAAEHKRQKAIAEALEAWTMKD